MPPTHLELRHIPELDGIRGIAVLGVVVLHFYSLFPLASRPLGPLTFLVGIFGNGVDIFFVLSGYLITSILIATRHAENYFSAFYARRTLRIFPLCFLAIAAYFWIALPIAHRHGLVTGFHEREQLWYWLFLGNWRQGLGFNDGAGVAHFWTLGVEEQFYILFSVIVAFVSSRSLVRISVAMIAISVLLRALLDHLGLLNGMSVRLTPLHLDPLALGALLACAPRFRAWADRFSLPLIVLGFLGAALRLPAGLTITAVGLGATGAIARSCRRPVPLLRLTVLRSLGKYSYAMYVIHDFLCNGFNPIAKHHQTVPFLLATLLGGTLLSYALARLSWHLLEAPLLSLKSRFSYRMPYPQPIVADRLPTG